MNSLKAGWILAASALFAVSASGQPADPPRFAVASIKRNPARVALSMAVPMGVGYRPGGRLVAGNAPVTMLIQRAYGIQGYELAGGPSWIAEDGYDIDAKPEGNVDQKQMWLMLQTLLAERFKLAMHPETRDLPVYELRIGKGGPKLPPAETGPCAETLSGAPGRGAQLAPPCGPGVEGSDRGLAMLGVSVSMPALAKQLSLLVGREVVDKTGFTGRFALHLEFAMDEALAGLPNAAGPAVSPAPADGNGPRSLFAAIQEQLGLKLESAKGRVQVLVIDRVERPTEN